MPDETPSIHRRTLLKAGSTLAMGSALLSSGWLSACNDGTERRSPRAGAVTASSALSPEEEQLMDDVADTVLPTTPSSPGAKAAGVGALVNLLLTDCYDAAAQRRVTSGLRELRDRCDDAFGRPFHRLAPSERETLLHTLDAEAVKAGDSHWFHLVREVAQRAYFSSEVGMTRALRYVRVPGRWDGCVPLAPGQPAWG